MQRDGRKKYTLRQAYAAAVAQIVGLSHEEVEVMTIEQILARAHVDHYPVPFATARDLGWTPEQYNHPSNLLIRPVADHREKTARKDVPQIAKSKRISAEHAAFRARMLAKSSDAETVAIPPTRRKAKIPSRPFAKAPEGTRMDWKTGRRVAKD